VAVPAVPASTAATVSPAARVATQNATGVVARPGRKGLAGRIRYSRMQGVGELRIHPHGCVFKGKGGRLGTGRTTG